MTKARTDDYHGYLEHGSQHLSSCAYHDDRIDYETPFEQRDDSIRRFIFSGPSSSGSSASMGTSGQLKRFEQCWRQFKLGRKRLRNRPDIVHWLIIIWIFIYGDDERRLDKRIPRLRSWATTSTTPEPEVPVLPTGTTSSARSTSTASPETTTTTPTTTGATTKTTSDAVSSTDDSTTITSSGSSLTGPTTSTSAAISAGASDSSSSESTSSGSTAATTGTPHTTGTPSTSCSFVECDLVWIDLFWKPSERQ
ncbi:unnamed protein product, partial [Mesorhabditis spiculigera]